MTKPSRSTGSVTDLSLDIDSPIPMKGQNIEFKQLALFVGANGSGKTFILICTWAISMIAQMIVITKAQAAQLIQYAQYTFDNSFKEQNINGKLSMIFSTGAQITIDFDKGKVVNLQFSGFEDINQPTQVKFMSAAMRTFDAISTYLGMRGMIKKFSPGIGQEALFAELCKTYRLYDVMYIEGLIAKLPILITPPIKDALKNFDIKEDITGFGFEEDKVEFYTTIANSPNKYLSTYSKGEQALLNMMLGNLI